MTAIPQLLQTEVRMAGPVQVRENLKVVQSWAPLWEKLHGYTVPRVPRAGEAEPGRSLELTASQARCLESSRLSETSYPKN